MEFEQLIDTYGEKLYNLATRITGDREEAHDIVQDTFVTAYEKQEQFRSESSIYTWLYRIAVNRSLQYKRTLTPDLVAQAQDEVDYSNRNLPDIIEDWGDNPEKRLHLKEMIAEVKAECHFFLLFILTPEQRITYLLRTVMELSFKEIGEILDIDENSAKARMNRIRSKLLKDFEKNCSHYSNHGRCNCLSCVRHIVTKHPEIIQHITGDSQFIEEVEEAFRHAGIIDEFYKRLPNLKFNSGAVKELFN